MRSPTKVVWSAQTETYSLLTREGRVGFLVKGMKEIESPVLSKVIARFRTLFRYKTSRPWRRRYDKPYGLSYEFTFVELDYTGRAFCSSNLPDYTKINAPIPEETREMMELMLYGGRMSSDENCGAADSTETRCPFGAPYMQLGSWTVYLGFRMLEKIFKYLSSVQHIHWKTIIRASVWYRSRIPFCAGHDRSPMISSYQAIFLELRFLWSLQPWKGISDMLTKVHQQASLQLSAHKALAQPLYQAYSSLRHGFKRLTDASTEEFQALAGYLQQSCHYTHRMSLELKDIYRVFVKANLPNPYYDWVIAKQDNDACGEERRLLWHGTPLDSLLGILDLGLQIRRRGASLTGAMFGNGIYLADVSSKSAGYCRHEQWAGEAVLLLCEADVGSQRIQSLTSICDGHEVVAESEGLNRCIEGLGKTGPPAWKQVGWDAYGLPCSGPVLMVCQFRHLRTLGLPSLVTHGYVVLTEMSLLA